MKRYKSIVMAAVLGLGILVTGCEDWLDYKPKDKQTYEQQFETKVGFKNAVNGIYTNLSTNDLYGYNMSYGPLDFMGLLYNISVSNTDDIQFLKGTWTGQTASTAFLQMWSKAYATILNANLILQAAEEYKGTTLNEDEYTLIKGEMLAVRAFLHFDMLRLFGPRYIEANLEKPSIPYAESVEATRRELMPMKQLLETKLLPDLENAEKLLKEVDPVIEGGVLNSDGGVEGNWERYRQLRMNYYAVILLKARVYLWMTDYDKALVEARKLTDSETVAKHFPFVDPNKVLANSVNPDRIFSTECLFGYYKSNMKNVYLNTFSGTLTLKNLFQPRPGYLGTLFPSLGDYRFLSQWTGSAASGGSEYDFVKYRSFDPKDEDNPEFWATFFGLMRISEAYYIAAECLMNQNRLPEACDYLNTILNARGALTLDATSATLTKATVLREIKMEYLREMRGEGQIYFMFKRFNQPFGRYSTGGVANQDFDGSAKSGSEVVKVAVRYAVPLPTDETN